jgi:transketolase
MLKNNWTPTQKLLRKRILEISHSVNASHLGSCLNSIDLIYAVYLTKKPDDLFILSNGHAAVSWYAVLEQFGFLKNPSLNLLNIHPDRNEAIGIPVSTGSLGHGLAIAVGMALANKSRNVYCLTSDGEWAEGSMWESLRVTRELKLQNLKILISCNGWGAYSLIDRRHLKKQLTGFGFKLKCVDGHNPEKINISLQSQTDQSLIFAHTNSDQFPFLKDQDAHYYVMTNKDYQLALTQLI